ncbi:helix-turn-helix domain-containing protein [Nocardiopsis lambiniae]|uniref:Helix-turn-helix transcriptional regulator n=1 Tax=Nocardiopsis lambiniae TaxID=3075539 RepID=A0ABU2MF77_9ACTN|nr:helix-turn-helix transcriptional regulator [Nocardiopsis sp. DSM 44743]MDT0330896.1 helix-turn-helix transcriptional regulator [Nocardiopsis sp. DSM 44743]
MTKEDSRRFGEYLKALRENKGLGLRELSRGSGISPSLISLLEKGYQRPKVDTLKSLARALDVPLADLMHRAGYEHACGKPCIATHLRICYSHLPERAIQAIEDSVCRIEQNEAYRSTLSGNISKSSKSKD